MMGIATLTGVTKNAQGVVVYELVGEDGTRYSNVPQVSHSGCGEGRISHMPLEVGHAVLYTSVQKTPYILAGIMRYDDASEIAVEQPQTPPVTEMYSGVSAEDLLIQNADESIVLSETNGTTIATRTLRADVSADGIIRLSRDGATSDVVLDGQQTINALVGALNDVATRIEALTSAVSAIDNGMVRSFAGVFSWAVTVSLATGVDAGALQTRVVENGLNPVSLAVREVNTSLEKLTSINDTLTAALNTKLTTPQKE